MAVNANVNVFKFSFPRKTIKYKADGEKYTRAWRWTRRLPEAGALTGSRQLGREFSRERRIVKLLLLGTGQAGPV